MKNSSHPFFFHTCILHTFPNCSSEKEKQNKTKNQEKTNFLRALSCKQEAERSCAYWEEVTSLPCRKYNYSIVRSSRCLIGLVQSSLAISSKTVSVDKRSPTDVPNDTKLIRKRKQSLSEYCFLSGGVRRPKLDPPFRCSWTVLLRGGICSPDIEKSIHKCIVGDQWKSVGVFKLYVRSIPELDKDGKRRRGGKNQKTDRGCSPAQRETPEGHTAESVRQLSSGVSPQRRWPAQVHDRFSL